MIRVRSIQVDGPRVTYRISQEDPVDRFLVKDSFYLKADRPLDSVPPGILAIPLLGCLVPVSWVSGSMITMDVVDETFLEALPRVRAAMQLAYPRHRFLGSVQANPSRIESPWDPGKYGLLYSGGIDSLTSFLRNRTKNPELLMVQGTPDFRLEEKEFISRSMARLTPAIKELGGEIHAVETDALNILDYGALQESVKKTERNYGWWEKFAHGLFLTSMFAPFTYVTHMGRLLIASSFYVENPKPWGSMPASDEQIRWAGLQVVHDSFDLNKFDKIRNILVPFVKASGRRGFPVRVCTGQKDIRLASGKLNCGRCGKCMRTMLLLLENGIDPAECGFDTSHFFPDRIRIGLENGYIRMEEAPGSWVRIFEHAEEVPAELQSEYRGMREFALWAAGWDRKPKESALRSFSRSLAPVGSRRRQVTRKILRKD